MLVRPGRTIPSGSECNKLRTTMYTKRLEGANGYSESRSRDIS